MKYNNRIKASNLFEVLLYSSHDSRFSQFVKCFEVLFNCPVNDLMEEFNVLASMTNITTTSFDYRVFNMVNLNFNKVSTINAIDERLSQK